MLTTGYRHSLLCSLVAFTCMGHSLHSTSQTMSVDVRHSEGGGVGYSQSYTSLDGFFGYEGENYLPFLDARGHVFNDGKFAANVGVGTREVFESACLAVGANVFYDYRDTHRHSYNQLGIGFEVIKPWWEIHVNGYFPFGKRKSGFFNYRTQEYLVSSSSSMGSPSFDHFAGHELFLLFPGSSSSTFERIKKKRQEFAMTGVDADINVHLVKAANINFEAAAGPYYYRGYYGSQAVGGKARVTARWSDYIAGEFAASYDNIFHGRIHGGLSLIYPFGPKIPKKRDNLEKTCNSYPDLFYDRLVQRVDRAEIIVVDRKRFTKKETFTIAGTTATVSPAIDPDTGLPWNFIFVRSVGGGGGFGSLEGGTFGASDPGDGTFENPYTLLADAEAPNSKPRDIIYIYAGTGTTEGYNSGFLMQDYQKMWGAGIDHNLATTVGTVVVPAQDGTPEIGNFFSFLPNQSAIVVASNIEIAGLTVIDEIGHADLVFGADITNVLIQNNTFQLIQNDFGIYIDNSSGTQALGQIDFLHNAIQVTDFSMDVTAATFLGGTSTFNAIGNTFNGTMGGTFGSALFVELSYGENEVIISNNTLNDMSNSANAMILHGGTADINAVISGNIVRGAEYAYTAQALGSDCHLTLNFTNNQHQQLNDVPSVGLLFFAQFGDTTGNLTATGNTFSYTNSSQEAFGFDLENDIGSSITAAVSNNTVEISNRGTALYDFSSNSSTSTLTAMGNDFSFTNPVAGHANGFHVESTTDSVTDATLANNTCTNIDIPFFLLKSSDASNGLDVLMCNNTMSISSGGTGLSANNNSTSNFCLSVYNTTNNTLTEQGYFIVKNSTGDLTVNDIATDNPNIGTGVEIGTTQGICRTCSP